MIRLDLATDAYIGARSQQQDAAGAYGFGTTGGVVLVLGDGLGGHAGGAEASHIVRETFREAAGTGAFDNPSSRREALRQALDTANQRIANGVDPSHGQRGMASTVVAVVVAEGNANWISVGDSHFYLWRDGHFSKLNEDHSQAGLMLRSGDYQPNDPEVLAAKSILVSALTGRRVELVDHPENPYKLQIGDLLLLASDGLNTLSDEELAEILADADKATASDITTLLLDAVRERRADRQDNTAVVVARVMEFAETAKSPRTEIVIPTQITAPTDGSYSDQMSEADDSKTNKAKPIIEDLTPKASVIAAAVAAEKTDVQSTATPVLSETPSLPKAITPDLSASTRSTYPHAVTPHIDTRQPEQERRRSKLPIALLTILLALGALIGSLHYLGLLESVIASVSEAVGNTTNKSQPAATTAPVAPPAVPQPQPVPTQTNAPSPPPQQKPAAATPVQSPTPPPVNAPVVLPPANEAAPVQRTPSPPANAATNPLTQPIAEPTRTPGAFQTETHPTRPSPAQPTPPAQLQTPTTPPPVQQPR